MACGSSAVLHACLQIVLVDHTDMCALPLLLVSVTVSALWHDPKCACLLYLLGHLASLYHRVATGVSPMPWLIALRHP